MIQQPSVADPDRQFRRVRESFTAELFLLLSREMRKDRSSSPRRPESATVAPLHVLHGAWLSFNGGSSRKEGTSARPPAPAATTLDRPEPIFLSNGVPREALGVSRGSSDSSPNAVLIAYLLLHLHFQLLGDPRARKRRVKHEDIGRSHTL